MKRRELFSSFQGLGACAPETTQCASLSSPFSSTTPFARPFFMTTRATGALVRIVAPWCCAAVAMAWLTPPVPPFENPHERNAPSISPI